MSVVPLPPIYRTPPTVIVPLVITFMTAFPAVWSTHQIVRRVGATIMVLSIIAVVAALVVAVHRWLDQLYTALAPHRVRQLATALVDEIDGREWADLVRRMNMGEMPPPNDEFEARN